MTRYQAICDCGHTALWDTDEQAHADLRSHPCPDRPALTTAPDRTELAALVEQHLPLARSIARNTTQTTMIDYDDAYSDALFGLWDAARRYDPTRTVKFTTFATPRIRGQIMDGARSRDHLSRYARRNCPDATSSRWAAPISLDRELQVDSRDRTVQSLSEFIADTTSTEDAWVDRLDTIAAARRRIAHLNPRDQQIILDRFTTADTLAEIGARHGLTEARISQIVGYATGRRNQPYEQ